jgi:hypothetical protein
VLTRGHLRNRQLRKVHQYLYRGTGSGHRRHRRGHLEVRGRDAHTEEHPPATLERLGHRRRSGKIADEHVGSERTQRLSAVIVAVDERPHRQIPLSQQAHHSTADTADTSTGPGDQRAVHAPTLTVVGPVRQRVG